jgi:hypothetical protein
MSLNGLAGEMGTGITAAQRFSGCCCDPSCGRRGFRRDSAAYNNSHGVAGRTSIPRIRLVQITEAVYASMRSEAQYGLIERCGLFEGVGSVACDHPMR